MLIFITLLIPSISRFFSFPFFPATNLCGTSPASGFPFLRRNHFSNCFRRGSSLYFTKSYKAQRISSTTITQPKHVRFLIMSVMKICSATEVKCVEKIPPTTPVMVAVSSVIGRADDVLFANNGDRTFHRENIRGDVGINEWEVVFEGPSIEERFAALESRLQEQNNRIGVLEGTQLLPWIRNVAATVLLFLDNQPYPDKPSRRFHNARGDLLSRLKNYVNASATWELDTFLQAADAIVTRRNIAIHPSSVDELDALVEQAQDAISRSPTIRSTLRQEIIVIEEYNEIKKFFPGNATAKGTDNGSEIDDSKRAGSI